MKTTRTISNVSYNTLPFFEKKIAELEDKRVIDWAYWIYHTAEEDEEKDHIHFVLRPSARIDTMDLRQYFFEYVNGQSLPLTCTKIFLPTNSMTDWLLYAVHDVSYLRSKGQWRKYHYNYTDLQSTDKDALKQDWDNINRNKFMILDFLEQAVQDNIPFYRLVQDGIVPMAQRSQYEFQYKALFSAYTAEKNRETLRKLQHEELIFNDKVEQLSIKDIESVQKRK